MQQNPSSAASNNNNNSNNSNNNNSSSSSRPAMRSSSTLKTSTDGSRRQAASPVDGAQRRNNPPKAWTQSTNPLTQKPSYPNQNGGAPQRKSTISPNPMASSSPNRESNTPDMHANDRLTFLLAACIGLNATVTTKSGEKFSGIFSGSSLEPNDSSFALKMTQRCSSPQPDHSRSNGLSDHSSPYIGSGVDHQMIFDVQDVADVCVENVSTVGIAAKEQNGAPTGFKTDTDISGGQAVRERELQRWEPGTDAPVDLSLESAGSTSWDQFEVNERLFGATTSYDENLYTTRIDRSDPSYKRKEAEAARIAREIESSETDNAHLREERGLVAENDYANEEDKYSGVRREDFPPLQSGQPNKYTPPARRAPTSHPTVPGAPVDPAIISAQIARPDIPPKQSSQPKINITPSQTTITTSTTTTDAVKDKAPETTKSAPSLKPPTSSEQKQVSGKPTSNSNVPSKRNGVENASSNVEVEVLDHFRQFATIEKMKLQERRRNQASYDRTIKLNELMKFSKNFKLGTPVPKDLVPILAKDPSKQEEIIEKARRQHEEKLAAAAAKAAGATPPDASTATAPAAEQKPTAPRASGSSRYDVGAVPPVAPSDRQQYPRGRQGYPPMGPHSGLGGRPMGHHTAHPGRSGPGLLSHRLADIQQQRKGGAMGHPMPPPLPVQDGRIPPHGPLGGDQCSLNSPHKSVQSPTSATSTKFNVRAHEFKPNPAAHTFTPGGTSAMTSGPANARPQSISRAASPSAFFGAKKPLPPSERPSINDHFNPVKRMKKEATEQSTTKDYAFNGGIPQAYRTPPTWEVAPINAEKTYADMFKTPTPVPSASPQRAASNPQLPHQHQLPFHLQHSGPPTTGPPQAHPHPHAQSHHPSGPPLFEDHHRMHMSASTSQVYPSPRLQQTPVAYHSPMGHHAQLAYGQPVPQFYTAQGPQPAHMRHYPGGPQFVNPQNGMGAPMMVQQPSNGPYAGMPQGMGVPYNPQMPMYSPNAGHAYPQHVPPPPQPHSGYPSPSRGAPMMMHQGSQQGSQQGHPPQPIMFMNSSQHGQPVYAPQQPGYIPPVRAGYPQHQQSHFNTSPHQTHHYPHHQHRAQNNTHYNQMPHMHHPHMAPQGPPQNAPAGPHPPEAVDEVK
ncbi:PAB1 binding protein [Blastomyces dermatitidis ER-3]|uniref:PAB1 binding protein n=2 Tax=Ajellomyces dermatitidis TaxID=5039 RepID=F2T8F6_AJEDA|nr:PAB1 binding protein [Blastomyces dermatitidis ER-3]EEQ88081.2 PAB1 binding protein [Blastomyces dermatitidis ER-3]EGE79519.2 PAB1 binding protein [Blastomyces dermatitidis ATCC 18188]